MRPVTDSAWTAERASAPSRASGSSRVRCDEQDHERSPSRGPPAHVARAAGDPAVETPRKGVGGPVNAAQVRTELRAGDRGPILAISGRLDVETAAAAR